MNLCIGSMYSWSVLSAPMAEELGVPGLSVVFSVASAVGFITMIIGGLLNDRYGPRWVMFTGSVMFGTGMFLCGFAERTEDLIFSYGILLGLGLSLVYGCTIGNTVKIFPDRRGMAGGMTTACYGISSVIFAPVAEELNRRAGVRWSFWILGGCFLIVLCAGSLLVGRWQEEFFLEYGRRTVRLPQGTGTDRTPVQMLRTPVFYRLFLTLTCGATFGMMVISSARGLAVDIAKAGAARASFLVSLLCLFNTAGRLISGWLSDRLGRYRTLEAALTIALTGMFFLYQSERTASAGLFTAGMMLTGICFGTFMGVFPGLCSEQFGETYNTVNYGILWTGFSAAGLLGPSILTEVYRNTGCYRDAFLLAGVLAVVGFASLSGCRLPEGHTAAD